MKFCFLQKNFSKFHSPHELIILIEKSLPEYFDKDNAELIVALYVPTLVKHGDQ